MPFQMMGLWLAVIASPPSALRSLIMTPTVGVIATPMSMTSHPVAMSPPMAAAASGGPLIRPSRPTTTTGRALLVVAFRNEPNAAP